MSCAQVAGMSTAGLVAMRSSCPRNPPGSGNSNSSKPKTAKEGYGAEVAKPGPHDVLLGRGGGTNNHSGNRNFRTLVNEHKMRYLSCSKIEKPNVAREVVELWKKLEPPGRFLTRKEDGKKSEEQTVWVEVPEKKAREKASQCLRERTPDVVPYIRQLREQQDQMTEQGVSMVHEQLKMHREAEAQKNSLHGMAAAAAGLSRRNSLAEHNPYQQASPMTAMSGGADFSGRRGSMPMMQGCGANDMMMNMQQQQQAAFSRRVSAPHLSSGSNHSMPANASAMMGQMTPQFAGSGMMEPGFVGSDMYDASYASSMTAMQLQQHHQQQLQLQQQLQQQQMLQHQMMQQQQMAQANVMHMENMRSPRSMMAGMDAQQQWNMQAGIPNHSGHGSASSLNHSAHSASARVSHHNSMKDNSSSSRKARVPDAPKSAPAPDMEPLPLPKPDKNTSASLKARDPPAHMSGSSSSHKKKNGKSKTSKKKTPESPKATPTKTLKAPSETVAPQVVTPPIDPPPADDPLPLDVHTDDEEVGIEEYRKTLESYMVSNNISTQNPVYYSDEDDLSVESFPEWPDEGDHPERDDKPKQRGRAAPGVRKVDRHKSGQSMMSCKTFKSNTTSLSGLSMLSDMMSMESGPNRDDKMSSRRFSSNASIMSELTDLSHTIDGLDLDDDI